MNANEFIQSVISIYWIPVDDVPFGYDCVICRERYTTRTERNDHLETHFVHRNCNDCNRLVIIIGDLEFELHKPTHCTEVKRSDSVDYKDIDENDRLTSDGKVEIELNDFAHVVDNAEGEVIKDDTDSEDCILQITDDNLSKEESESAETSKPNVKVRGRKKSVKKKDDTGDAKKVNKTTKTRTVKILTCTQDGCTEEFRQQQMLRKHLKTVHGVVEKHLCSICNFAFADKSNLKHHMVTHTDNKRFICSFCGARFHKLTNMTEHMNAHLGLKPYKCDTCGKNFGRSNHKRQHMRVHTGEKPYSCHINDCSRAYMFKIDLKRHMRSIHGIIDKTFSCQICSKIFYENKYLTKHLATAHT